MTHEIENNIAIPSRRYSEKRNRYPFENMEKGQSFFVPIDEGYRTRHTLQKALLRYAHTHFGEQVCTSHRTIENEIKGVRIWRVR